MPYIPYLTLHRNIMIDGVLKAIQDKSTSDCLYLWNNKQNLPTFALIALKKIYRAKAIFSTQPKTYLNLHYDLQVSMYDRCQNTLHCHDFSLLLLKSRIELKELGIISSKTGGRNARTQWFKKS